MIINVNMFSFSYLFILERSKTARVKAGLLFAHLIKLETLPLPDYCAGLEEVLNQADDLRIDIPKIWDYLADILGKTATQQLFPSMLIDNSRSFLISATTVSRSSANQSPPQFLQSPNQAGSRPQITSAPVQIGGG